MENKNYNHFDTSLKESLFNEDVKDVFEDVGEQGIDAIIDSVEEITDIAKSVPLIKTIIAVKSTAESIWQRHLIKQTLEFFRAFYEQGINYEKLDDYRERISNPHQLRNETDRIMLILQTSLDKEKANLLGKLYRKYVYSEIDYHKFKVISNAIYSIFLDDICILKKYYCLYTDNGATESLNEDSPSLLRLQSLGMLQLDLRIVYDSSSTYDVSVNDFGGTLATL